jgi:hypothetical protein
MSCIKICNYMILYLDRLEIYLDNILIDYFNEDKIIDLQEIVIDKQLPNNINITINKQPDLIDLNNYILL